MQNKFYVAALILATTLTACGKHDDSPAPAAPQPIATSPDAPAPGPDGGWQNFPQIRGDDYSHYFYVNYQFNVNGCDTGLHRFSGGTYEETRRNLCDGLRNEWMNGNCAREMRHRYHRMMCR